MSGGLSEWAMLRRLAGSPVAPPENFIVADADKERLGSDQATPRSPDKIWPEAPEGWEPPRRYDPTCISTACPDFRA